MRAGLLRAFERNGHRDAAETARRKALFSLSKKPSSAGSSQPGAALELLEQFPLFRGEVPRDDDVDEHPVVPRARSPGARASRDRRARALPGCVPAWNVSSDSPLRVSTVRVVPSATSAIVRSSVE